ncbi:AraC family transcriptional regulator [Clostridium sp. KNHs205]|uniref:helix-turn-helix transcriptional regulator n=1 Tax=Clostridium sp. KNHs205 TaxID=1449050 RepID=UPI00051B8DF2|nr:AraC family transcriptional regulator [Clostridium sp. KNHs205]
MYEWIYAIQKMIDWIDDNAINNPSLSEISGQIGYSPYYCSTQFHRIAGMTLKSYMAKRRLCKATLAIRDSCDGITDIALDYGFSSQTALTRAFKDAYGCTPAAYRKNPIPIPISMKKIVITPSYYIEKGDLTMDNLVLPSYRIEYIPAHRYLGVYKRSTTKNGVIWPGHDCDLLTGIVSSISDTYTHPIVTGHTAGWIWSNRERYYFYGLGVNVDYNGDIPEGFELRGEFPGSYYIVFSHPPFNYLSANEEVMRRVEKLAWSFDPEAIGYEWNEEVCQDYQRHYPEGLGYQILRPVKKI